MIYSFPKFVLRYFTLAQIITFPHNLDSGFQQGSISKLDTGVGTVPQDEGKPILSGIWETVTMLPNEDTGYGLLEEVYRGSKEPQTQWTPQTGSYRHTVNIHYSKAILFWFN